MAEAGGFFEWPCGHSWQGTHMFRHGGVQDGFKEGRAILAKLRSGHKSDKSLRLYAASDAERTHKLKDLTNQKTSRENFLNTYLEKITLEANKITTEKNTTKYFEPATFNFAEQEKTQQNLKWTKMVNVWMQFKKDILGKREECKIDINNSQQTNNNNIEKLEQFLAQKFLEINKTMKDLSIDISNEMININSKLANLENQIKNNNKNNTSNTQSKTCVTVSSSKKLKVASLNTTYTNDRGELYELVKDPNKIVTEQDKRNMKYLNWSLNMIMESHNFFWSIKRDGWVRFIK
jgi:hypothetical protein